MSTAKTDETLVISVQTQLNEAINLAEYLRQRNLALAQHLANQREANAELKAENQQLRDDIGTMTPAEPNEVNDAE